MQKDPEAFRTISEAADELDVPQHVLRFWETRFSQIRPMKRAGGRRYYRPQDIDLLKGIRKLLYDDGYTIKGVQKILREHGVAHVIAIGRGEAVAGVSAVPAPAAQALSTLVTASAAEVATEERPAVGAKKSSGSSAVAGAASVSGGLDATQREELRSALRELEEARTLLKNLLAGETPRQAIDRA